MFLIRFLFELTLKKLTFSSIEMEAYQIRKKKSILRVTEKLFEFNEISLIKIYQIRYKNMTTIVVKSHSDIKKPICCRRHRDPTSYNLVSKFWGGSYRVSEGKLGGVVVGVPKVESYCIT